MITSWCTGCRSKEETCVTPDLHRAKGLIRHRADFYLGGRHGTRIKKIFPPGITKKEAEKYEHLAIADYERGTFLPRSKTAITFANLADRYYTEHCLENNVNAHLTTKYRIEKLKGYIGKRIARDIKRQDLKDLRTKLRADGLAPATVNRYYNDLKAIFYKGVEWELLEANPCEFITKLQEDDPLPQFATQAEINQVRRAAQNLKIRSKRAPQRILDAMTVLLHSGARPSSMRRCRWENGDVDFQNKTIWYTTFKGRKKYRYPHPIDDVLLELLTRRASVTGKKGSVFDTINLTKLGTAAIRASGINNTRPADRPFTFYALKHCYASHLLMNGASLDEVRRLLGHTDMKMVTKHYGFLTQEYLAKVQSKVNLTPKLDDANEVQDDTGQNRGVHLRAREEGA